MLYELAWQLRGENARKNSALSAQICATAWQKVSHSPLNYISRCLSAEVDLDGVLYFKLNIKR